MESIEHFICNLGNGNGNGNGNGYGYGYGYGDGDGDGDGSGNGNGNGNGYGYGSGYGYGDGDGYGDGSGNGNGYGYGSGYGYGDGDGYGDGSGNGDGSGYGNGNGNGYGDGISEYNSKKVYNIDSTPTIIESVKGDIARGYILRYNVYLQSCYIAKCGMFFAHGETAKQAMMDARAKYEENKPLSERIDDTIKKCPSLDTIVLNADLYLLHHILTGSCKFGRDEFIDRHNIDIDGSMTMQDFITLTENEYGKEAIKELKNRYNGK